MYREKALGNPPALNTCEYEALREFALEVKIILHSVNDNEFQAAVISMKPPDGFTEPIQNFPEPSMVVGTFAKHKAVLVQTDPGIKCQESIEKAVELFPNAMYIIAVGVCYAFDNKKYHLGDVLVSKTISDFAGYKFKRDNTIEDRGETKDVEGNLSSIFCRNTIHNPQFNVTEARESNVYSGQFLSLPSLMDNKTDRDKFHAAAPYAIGGEMEGGVLMKIQQKPNNIRGIIIIKGVVDYGDGQKEKQWQFTSALAAVHYTHSKLSAVNLPGGDVAPLLVGNGTFAPARNLNLEA